MADKSLCSIPDCVKPAVSGRKGLCGAHYKRAHRYGDPLAGQKMRPEKGEPLAWLKRHISFEGDECLIWPYARNVNSDGYGKANDEDGSFRGAHWIMCRLAHGEKPDEEYQAAHSCGKGHEACVNPKHLSWKKLGDNNRDRIAHGTVPRAEEHPNSKLTQVQVDFIRSRPVGLNQPALARMFDVHQGTISGIQLGKSWRQ